MINSQRSSNMQQLSLELNPLKNSTQKKYTGVIIEKKKTTNINMYVRLGKGDTHGDTKKGNAQFMMNVRENMGDYEKSQAGFMENVYIVHWNLRVKSGKCVYLSTVYIYIHIKYVVIQIYIWKLWEKNVIS